MFRVALINMPFASLRHPSLGLTQLEAVIRTTFGARVQTDVLYLNQDVALYLGVDVYDPVAMSVQHHMSGLGEWFFRHVAFPELTDNTQEYLRRYYSVKSAATTRLRERLLERRPGLEAFLHELIARYRLDSADLVGLTSMFSQNMACFAIARLLKTARPAPRVVMGGANCESPMGQAIADNVPALDAVFAGPALKSLPAYVDACLRGDLDATKIPGVLAARPRRRASLNRLPVLQAPHVAGEDLDIDEPIELEYTPFLERLAERFPDGQVEPILTFETSRGCWWGAKAHCTFCGLNGSTMAYRAMKPANALAQFDRLFRYADRCSRFESVDNILPTNYPKDVLPYLQTPPQAEIFYEVKADLSDEDLRTLARAHVRIIQPGIESLATSTLKLMKKGTSAFSNVAFLRGCLMYEIWPAWNLLIGFPGEEPAVYAKYHQDIPNLVHLPPPLGVFPIRFDRYSPYFVRAAEYRLALQPMEFYRFVYPFDSAALDNMAYYFSDQNAAAYSIGMAQWHGRLAEAINRWRQAWDAESPDRRPALFVRQNGHGSIVHDSRRGTAVEYPITPPQLAVLKELAKPTRVADLGAVARAADAGDADAIVRFLDDHALLFREGDRVMSLVCPSAPPEGRPPK